MSTVRGRSKSPRRSQRRLKCADLIESKEDEEQKNVQSSVSLATVVRLFLTLCSALSASEWVDMAGEKQFDRKGGEQILTREKKKKKNRSRREEILLLAIKWALSRGLGK